MTFLELSLSGGVFILAIAAFRAVTLRRLPKGTFVALWWLAAARLLLPVELASRFSVYTLLESLRPKASALPTAPAAPLSPVVPVAPAAPPVITIPTQLAVVPAPAPAPFPVWTVLWIAVGVLLAAWFLIRYVRWRRRFREALPADCPGLETWFQLRRKVEVRVTDQIAAPLTYGLLRPVVLLPKTLDFADEEALTCVLAHERAHIRRFDGLLKLALTAALCLHWFNPAAWLLYLLGNRDMELRCDEAAVLALGEGSRERYALALIRLAEKQTQHVPLCGFSDKSGMEERIKAIMSIKKKSLLACCLALALVMSITTAFATSAKPQEADGKETVTAPSPKPAAQKTKPVGKEPLPEDKTGAPIKETTVPPVDGGRVTQPQQTRTKPETGETETHNGADVAAVKGTPIYAAGKGTIKETGFNAKDGNFVRIDHGSGQESFYAHCGSLLVKTGDEVMSGQTIATVGNTGMSTGPHLHFEFLVNGVATDPMAFCRTDYQNNDNSRIDPFWASVGSSANPRGDSGNPIIAIMDGTVLNAGMKEKGEAPGLYVEILYENNYSMIFQECQSIHVKAGDSVKTGDIIAYAGERLSGEGPSTPQDRADEERNRQEVMGRMVDGEYPRNSRGETYGKYGDARYMGYEADLVGAVTTDGLDGWVYSKMLSGHAEDVMTPEQMADYQESLKMEGFHMFRFAIPVYDDDGNEIGVFERGIQIGNPFGTMEEAQEAVRNGEI